MCVQYELSCLCGDAFIRFRIPRASANSPCLQECPTGSALSQAGPSLKELADQVEEILTFDARGAACPCREKDAIIRISRSCGYLGKACSCLCIVPVQLTVMRV